MSRRAEGRCVGEHGCVDVGNHLGVALADIRRAFPLDLEEFLEGTIEQIDCKIAGDAFSVRRVAKRSDESQVGRLGLGGLSPPDLEELEAVAVTLVDHGVTPRRGR